MLVNPVDDPGLDFKARSRFFIVAYSHTHNYCIRY